MGQAKQRGTYEQRRAEAIDLKQRFIRAMQDHFLMRGKSTLNGVAMTREEASSTDPDRIWYDESSESESVQGGILCLECGWIGFGKELVKREPLVDLGNPIEVCPKCFGSKLGTPYG